MANEENKITADKPDPNLSKEDVKKITKNLNDTLLFGLITGFIAVVGYTFNLQNGRWKLMFLSILLASASYIAGFFLGFLFGIPKRNTEKESSYNLNNNLGDISDWLTKIIIGLGLIEIKRIPGYLQSIGEYIQHATNSENSVQIFSVCCIVYFIVFGLYYGHNYTRLILSGQYKVSDDNLLKLSEKGEVLGEALKNKKDISSANADPHSGRGEALNKNVISPDNVDPRTKKNLAEYIELLKNTKTEAEYTFEDWYFKGVAAYDNKEYNKTIAYMNNALQINAKHKNAPDAYLYIGVAWGNLERYEDAIKSTNEIINNYQSYGLLYLAYFNNSIYCGKLEDYKDALNQINKADQLFPNNPDILNQKIYILRKLDLQDDLLAVFDKIINTKTGLSDAWYPYAWYSKACIYARKNDKDKMLANLKTAIDLSPDYKKSVKTDECFKAFWNEEDFIKLIE